MSSKALISTRLNLSMSHKSTISYLLCLLNNRIFIYFNSGRYQHLNLKDENEKIIVLNEGKIDTNLYNLQALSDTKIFYINLNKKCFEVFDLNEYKVISDFGSPLPTSIAFSPSDRGVMGEDIMKFETDVVIFRDSQRILLFEQNKKGQDQKFGVTVFNEETCKNQGFLQQFLLFGILNSNSKPINSKINEIDTVAIFYQSNEQNIPKIWLLNISNKHIRVISTANSLPGTILDIKPWEANKLSIWINYTGSEKVKMAIIDYENAKITKEGQNLVELQCDSYDLRTLDEGTSKSHLLMDVIDVDYSQGLVFLWLGTQIPRSEIFLYDTKTLKECFRKVDSTEEEGNFFLSLSIDKTFFVEFPRDEGDEDKETEEIFNYYIIYSRILPFKLLTADLMEKTGIFERFGEHIGKEILDAVNN